MHMDEGTAAYVIAHEHAHLARRDHWWKVLGYLVLALHWFNPLVWVAYILFCRDIELACDEKVVRGLMARHAQTIHRRYYPAPRRKEPSRPARWHSARGTSKRA